MLNERQPSTIKLKTLKEDTFGINVCEKDVSSS